jgi:hypothetical protein
MYLPGHAHVDILRCGLGKCDFGQSFDLAWEARLVRAEILEAEVFWVEREESAESTY